MTTQQQRPDSLWRYRQQRESKSDFLYSGDIIQVDGQEGDRLRRELAIAIRDLLTWSSSQKTPETPESENANTPQLPEV
ncbi:hypothetical protein [Amycolatopsis sp. NPDC059657]|uniref:hypothetical protein n=1 Tax=Amycolatopsis sp. NPDC059657 TaxID=3346899 RepID=UPI00367186F0